MEYPRLREAWRDSARQSQSALPRLPAAEHDAEGCSRALAAPETKEFWALRDVSLHVEPGTSIGFIGRNGSGKTTLLRLVAGIFAPTGGRLEVGGSVGSLLELGAGFHPDFTGRENIYLSGSIYGLKRRESTVSSTRSSRSPSSSGSSTSRFGRTRRGCSCGSVSRSRRTWGGCAPAGRGVRGRRRGLPAQMRRPDHRLHPAGRHALLRLARGVRGRAPVRASDDAGPGRHRVRRRLRKRHFAATTRSWLPRRVPAEVGVELRESGTGELRVVGLPSRAPTGWRGTASSRARRSRSTLLEAERPSRVPGSRWSCGT